MQIVDTNYMKYIQHITFEKIANLSKDSIEYKYDFLRVLNKFKKIDSVQNFEQLV